MTKALRFAATAVGALAFGGAAACAGEPPGAPAGDSVTTAGSEVRSAMTFRGTIPCADCPGIELTVTLLPDGTFRLRQRYLDRDPLTTWLDLGRWTEEDGGRLALRGVGEGPVWFARFGWDSLRVLDGERRELPSDLPSGLRRAGEVDPVHDVQPLEGMVARSAAGAMIFAECRTGVAFPVSMEGAYAELERAFWKGSAAAEPLLVRVRGSLLGGPAEGDPGATSLVVEAVEGAFPGAGCAETVSDLPLEGTEWLLLELAGSPLPAGIVATLLLDGTDGQATGSGGCNSFVGRYGLHGARLTFANLAIAARACTSPTKDMEEAYLRTLARVGGYRLMGADLQLLAEEGVVARFRSR